ncbi:SLC45 family MFS transporter [Dysgonomonas sp. Marseille-P4677]|uniref:SLC45 family MFS transporter n=1 Tax=Dysgonomonas sp. Marseille-P4677 TaxID=2364790 RepID=UPI001911F8D5|nr:SLC45 family MFS transporter [Dysgonomonas sp. Marseille-P4677]MBK5719945.1 SLC45 family MFS transporter [Dysgonomonas sp. Marseille-P4677]
MKQKPTLTFWQIWNLSFGFLGIQIGYSLQSSQTSRILSALGADLSHLNYYWLAAPIAGLIVQPIIGMSSDRTWTRFGRRIPFILGGAIVSAIAMFFMPNSEFVAHIMPPFIFGAFMLLFMDCAFNVSMQPFRSLVGDMVNDKQRNLGYSTQSFLTNVGAVVGSFLPFILTWIGIRNIPNEGEMVPPSVITAFYFGGGALLLTVLWTSFKVKEYAPKEYEQYNNITDIEKERRSFISILKSTPKTMLQLGVVQFFSWFALFIMWVYATDGIAENVWHTKDPLSKAYNEAGNWNGVLSGIYGVFAAVFSIFMAKMADKVGRKKVYSFALMMGALGLVSMYFFDDKNMLLLSMLGVGIAWAGILAMPYAILSAALPPSKMGVYMGIFNATITIPQIAAGLTGGLLLKHVAGGSSITMLVVAGVSMFLAAVSVVFVQDSDRQLKPETID